MIDFVRKDVCDTTWSQDRPDQFCIIEKNRLYVVNGTDAEEPINSSGCITFTNSIDIADFQNLEVKTVLLDDIMKAPRSPLSEYVITIETKAICEVKSIILFDFVRYSYCEGI